MSRIFLIAAAAAGLAACNPPAEKAADPSAGAAASPEQAMASYTAAAREAYSGGEPVTPAEVSAMIAAQGAQPTVAALYDDGENSRWTTVMGGVASGAAEWLALVPSLIPGTENATAYEIGDALKVAMVANPTAVLTLIDEANPMLTTDAVCSAAGIEQTPEWYDNYYDALTPAVESVTDPALATKKAACLTILKARAHT